MKDLLDYGTAIERLRERRGLSREDLARGSGSPTPTTQRSSGG